MSQRTCLLRGPHANPDSISASWRRPSLILSVSFNWCTYLKAEGMEETFFRKMHRNPVRHGRRGAEALCRCGLGLKVSTPLPCYAIFIRAGPGRAVCVVFKLQLLELLSSAFSVGWLIPVYWSCRHSGRVGTKATSHQLFHEIKLGARGKLWSN